MNTLAFLPVSREEMLSRDWYYYDFLLITGDAYIDHPSFGAAIISRVLEAQGYRVAILAQPPYRNASAIKAMGKPRYAALVTAGNLDSMVAHYTAAKKPRSEDFYSPGKKTKLRPDRATTVYTKLVKEAFPDLPIIIGGLEASLRRFAHYDYWDDCVRHPILFESGADLLIYGMGESAIIEVARKLSSKSAMHTITDIRGTAYIAQNAEICSFPSVACASFEQVSTDKKEYARAAMIQFDEHDPTRGRAVIQRCDGQYMIVNPPTKPLFEKELDSVYGLPYTREVHPMYDRAGGVPAIDEVRFSVIHNRGCFGACNFCALAFHQGRIVSSRSHESVMKEVQAFVGHHEFKGYVHDVGGPTANFRRPSCKKQQKNGICKNKRCLSPEPCKEVDADHTDYLTLLRKLRNIPGIKKVFIRSGIRFDFLMLDKSKEFFAELVKHHISGQLKVAPEHCISKVLGYMDKPKNSAYERFSEKYKQLNLKYGKEQFLVPYLISSHPGSTVSDAIALAEYLNKQKRQPEQVQDFYPTPGTLSTCMYHTGIDPRTMESVYIPHTTREKMIQRALLQWKRPENRAIVSRALREADRGDLIGYGKQCLIRPEKRAKKG
ncbi:MAG: YgiQ family radical SAM protein [Oscillospiraceae bacterium]|nr:YgiQ family radical SAM protein [Oscillospiraceae bacterium]